MALYDLFNGSAGLLSAHTADSAHTWSGLAALGNSSLTGSGSVYPTDITGGISAVMSSFTPAAVTGVVAAIKFEVKSLVTSDFGVMLAASTAAGYPPFYFARASMTSGGVVTWGILKWNGSAFVGIGSTASGPTFVVGSTPTLTATRSGTGGGVLTLYHDGVQVLQVTDGSPLGNGGVGIWLAPPAVATTTTGVHALHMGAQDPITITLTGPTGGTTAVPSTAFTATLPNPSIGPTVIALASSGGSDVYQATSGGATVTTVAAADLATSVNFYLLPGGTVGARTVTPTNPYATFSPTTKTYTSTSATTSLLYDSVVKGAGTGYAGSATCTPRTWDGTALASPGTASAGTIVETSTPGTYLCRLSYPSTVLTTGVVPIAHWVVNAVAIEDPTPIALATAPTVTAIASAVASAILSTPANLLATNATGQVAASNLPTMPANFATLAISSAGVVNANEVLLLGQVPTPMTLATATTGTIVTGSTGAAVIVSGLPAGRTYTGKLYYPGAIGGGTSRKPSSQSYASGNYTFNFTGSAGTDTGPFDSVTTGDTVMPTP